MITSAANRAWPGDIPVDDLRAAGLPIPSVIRPSKIATVEIDDVEPRGRISAKARRAVETALGRYLA